ncbi:MBL fold metallo-hydrolase [Sphaerotilus hippei]|nr:MBL fold metallo-hydrolase [Sphaerotilus hippei]
MNSAPLPPWLHPLGPGLWCIDTGLERDHFDACYLMVDEGRAAFLDTGHNAAVPRLLGALDHLGLGPDSVDWVIPTHVHLDHAGGAGLLMQQLPHARALIHPKGARHLIQPIALIEGAKAVYGAEVMARTYGEIQPIDEQRVVRSHDEQRIQVGQRELRLIDAPGHANHHHAIWDERSRGWFTGDTYGISYRELDGAAGIFLFPTTTPVQFDPAALRQTTARMAAAHPQWLYLTHYGAVPHDERVARQFQDLLTVFETRTLALADEPVAGREAALRHMVGQALLEALRESGSTVSDERAHDVLDFDIQLNAQGLQVWLNRRSSVR